MMLQPTPSGFLRDGKPHLIVSGAIHYFRVLPELWHDRLLRLKAMGCNTVETYVAWNFHAPSSEVVDFTGWRDLERFLEIAADLGLDAIVRPGPYICAEWEGGGFPGWLMADPSVRLRVNDPAYLAHVDRWFDELIPRIAKHQTTRGGNVVMVQVENEYGSFGDDQAYLQHLRDGLIARGIDELLVTSDGPGHSWLSGGTIDGVLATVNFGSRADEVLEMCRAELPDQPYMCMEFWNGWFDHWGEEHHTRSAESAAVELETMLSNGMSVNFYMGHGGTNFGLWAGANHGSAFVDAGLQPTVTSYDYDSAIAEDGRLTEKFHAFREVIAKYLDMTEADEALAALGESHTAAADTAPQQLPLDWKPVVGSGLWRGQGLDVSENHPHPPAFEDLGLERGALLLCRRTQLSDGVPKLSLLGLHDRAWVFCDGELVGTCDRNQDTQELTLPEGRREVDLEILVYSEGRVNFGPQQPDRKGILRGVWLSPRFLNGWQATTWPLEDMAPLLRQLDPAGDGPSEGGPKVATVTFDVETPVDRHLDTSSLGRGIAWIGDFCLGRFDPRGPQRTLYVPAVLLRPGANTLTVLDFEPTSSTSISLVSEPLL